MSVSLPAREPLLLVPTTLLVVIHMLGLAGVVYLVNNFNLGILLASIGYFFLCHLAITAGAHRLFTHGAYSTNWLVARTLAVFFSGTLQGPLTWWCGRHFQHHSKEDLPGEDPHTPKDGFWHSHFLWTLRPSGHGPPPRELMKRFQKSGVDNETIRWQTRHYKLLSLLMVIGVPLGIGLVFGDWFGGLLFGFTRLVVQYHTTWVVNSIGHMWGERGDNLATNFGSLFYMPIAAIITVGEAWHANHHRSPAHWRLGRRWWQIDLGAYLIWFLTKCGLAWNLKSPADRIRAPQTK